MAAGFRGLLEVSGVYLSKSTSRGFLGLLALQGVTVSTAVKPRGFVGLADFVGLPGFGVVPAAVAAGDALLGRVQLCPSLGGSALVVTAGLTDGAGVECSARGSAAVGPSICSEIVVNEKTPS